MTGTLAAQLYTLRDHLKTPADITKSLAKVRKIGYRAVQVSGMGPIDAAELARILQGEGLTCCVTHMSLQRFQGEMEKVLDEHRLWGCQLTALGGFFKNDATGDDWRNFASTFGALCDAYAARGLRLGYHNHSHEFIRTPGLSKTPMQYLIDDLPRSAWIEIDTYWVQHGGSDPAAWIEKCFGRIPVVHLKDLAVQRDDGKVVPVMAEVGEGNLNWSRILQACRAAGVRWFCVEQDVCQRDPFESLEISYRNLRDMGLE